MGGRCSHQGLLYEKENHDAQPGRNPKSPASGGDRGPGGDAEPACCSGGQTSRVGAPAWPVSASRPRGRSPCAATIPGCRRACSTTFTPRRWRSRTPRGAGRAGYGRPAVLPGTDGRGDLPRDYGEDRTGAAPNLAERLAYALGPGVRHQGPGSLRADQRSAGDGRCLHKKLQGQLVRLVEQAAGGYETRTLPIWHGHGGFRDEPPVDGSGRQVPRDGAKPSGPRRRSVPVLRVDAPDGSLRRWFSAVLATMSPSTAAIAKSPETMPASPSSISSGNIPARRRCS